MTDSAVFFDASILVYANDTADEQKQDAARRLIAEVVRAGTGSVSTQVLAEFWVTVTQKIATPMSRALAQHQMSLLSAFRVVPVDYGIVLSAVKLQTLHQLSYWDAQILAAAQAAHCTVLYSEDFRDGARFGALEVRNPFL
ncbi:MAG: PIN domain-containing protein [Spirochaetaceae bacterium]|nr:MAG: PIN domain-containing protein [Spirochaetaceae bacterium]